MKLSEIADAIGGKLIGNGEIEIETLAHPADAEGIDTLALAMEEELVESLASSKAIAAVVLTNSKMPADAVEGYVEVGRARVALAQLMNIYEKPVYYENTIHSTAVIDPSASIGKEVSIGPFVYVGPHAVIGDGTILMAQITIGAEAIIGEASLIHPGVRIGERVRIGEKCIIHHNASIGSDGFSFVTPEPGSVEEAKGLSPQGQVNAQNLEITRINSVGSVSIGGHVEIGASTTIDRGTFSDTRIGRYTKIDNLVQVGHNVVIGENCMICGQVGVAGSVTVGDRVVLAGQVGVADHINIGNDVVVGGGSGIAFDIPDKTVAIGYPALPKNEATEQYMQIRRLGSIYRDIPKLKSRLKALETASEKG